MANNNTAIWHLFDLQTKTLLSLYLLDLHRQIPLTKVICFPLQVLVPFCKTELEFYHKHIFQTITSQLQIAGPLGVLSVSSSLSRITTKSNCGFSTGPKIHQGADAGINILNA